MVKKTAEQIASRREEIVNACEKLYRTLSFKEITLKEIGEEVPFSRPTIYNSFQTKEEIFLALFEREYDRWNADLASIIEDNEKLEKNEIAKKIALSLSDRTQLLKLLSMNIYDMEANSRTELLTEFKKAYGRSIQLFCAILTKFCPEKSASEIQNIVYIFYPFMFGIYPYAEVTDKQREAMRAAEVGCVYQSVYDIIYSCLVKLL